MRLISRRFMQKVASGVELILSAFLTIVIIVLIFKLIGQSFTNIWDKNLELEYYLEYAMTLAIGIEFVKMLYTHTPGTIIEVLLFAISRQMIIEHLSVVETMFGVGAIAGLFAVRKYLFCSFDETDHIICRGSQTIRHANLIAGIKIPEDNAKLLRDAVTERLNEEGKTIAIGACTYYKDCALRVDSMKQEMITRVEVIKSL